MYQINRAPSFQIPGLDRFVPIKHDYSGIERGLSALGKGLVTSLEERKLQEALDKANNPEIEKLQRAQQATQEELKRAQDETAKVLEQEARQAVYGSANPKNRTPEQEQEVQDWLGIANTTSPAEQARGLEQTQWTAPNAQTQQDYYRVGNQEFRDTPDPQALGIITAREKAKAWEAKDPRLAMLYEADAQRQLAQQMEQRYLQLEQTRDVPGAVRLHSDIPDGITSIEKKLPDGTWEVYTHPDGKPDAAKLFARGTEDDVFNAIRRSMDPKAWDAAAKLKRESDRQAMTDQRYAQQESRLAGIAERQELATQLTYLQKMRKDAKTEAEYVRYGMMEEEVVAKLMGMGQGGAGGPGQGQGGAEPGRDYSLHEKASKGQISGAMKYRPILEQAGDAAGVDPLLLVAMSAVESAGNRKAVSPKGAQGLMQLMPDTAKRFGVTDPNDPAQSARGGAEYMAWLINRFGGNLEHALAGYNAGEGRVDQHGGIPPFKETREYVPKVLATYKLLREQYGNQPAAQPGGGAPVVSPGLPGGGLFAAGVLGGGTPVVSPGLAPADTSPAGPAPQNRAIGTLGTDLHQAWAARQAAGNDLDMTTTQKFNAWQAMRKAALMQNENEKAQEIALERIDNSWRGKGIDAMIDAQAPGAAGAPGGGQTVKPIFQKPDEAATAEEAAAKRKAELDAKPVSERLAILEGERQKLRDKQQETTQKRKDQAQAREAVRSRLTELRQSWAAIRMDKAAGLKVMAELDAMEKNFGEALTPADRKEIESVARLLFTTDPKNLESLSRELFKPAPKAK